MTNDIRIDVNKLHPLLRFYLERTIKYANKEGIYLIITEGVRTVAQQDALYAKGRTKPGIVCTNARGCDYSSQHQWGIAFDIAIANPGHLWDEKYFRKVAEIAKQHCKYIGWGGDWTVKEDGLIDRPHFYLNKWGKNPSPLKDKYKTPERFFKTFKGTVKGTRKGLSIWNRNKDKRLVEFKPNGTEFYILSIGRKWAHVYYNGTYGYALKKYLKYES
jgi:peptidoglycan L-alanyl-D-glutamate endopeptidase CwlK